jgi:signal transduction histidine kinase
MRPSTSVKRVGEHLEFSVIDDGCGIAEEHLGRIFERFYRVDSGRSRQNGGSGIGLAIVKNVAIAHGGTVKVHSVLGEGSTFTLVIPLLQN